MTFKSKSNSFKKNEINTTPQKKMTRYHSSPFPTCFRPQPTNNNSFHAPPPTATSPNLTTSLYQTQLGLFSLTWSRAFLARTLHVHLHPSSTVINITIKPFVFWTKHGIKEIRLDNCYSSAYILWDFTRAKFGPGPEPESGYYIAVISSNTTILFLGDLVNNFNRRVNNNKIVPKCHQQTMVVRREHVCGAQFYNTKTNIGGKIRDILIEVNNNKSIEDDPRLIIRVDNKRVVQVKHLKWKFRGSERFNVDGNQIQLSWDVYNYLFDEDINSDERYALFTFRFEPENVVNNRALSLSLSTSIISTPSERDTLWSQDSCGLSYERKKMKKKLLVKTSSSSSSSLSSASSCGSSSVLDWESVEENELKAPTGFSLLVYAWRT